ncbi:MAG: hypothetical protein ACLUHE_15345 [Christensenellales bacterium]
MNWCAAKAACWRTTCRLCAFQNPKDGFLRVPLTRALHAGRKRTIRPVL